MSYLQLTANDCRLSTEQQPTTNNPVNLLMPYCFFDLHLTFMLGQGLKRKICCTCAPFITQAPNETLLW